MKKLMLIILVLVFFTQISQAQEDRSTSIRLGFKVGANYSNVYDTEGEAFHSDPKLGLAAGLFVSIPIGNFLGIQPEILFSQKGFKATGSVLGNSYELSRTTSYVDVPLLIAIRPVSFLSILAGPQYSFLVKQKDVFSNSAIHTQQEQDFKNDNVRKNTLCFLGGVDINLKNVVIGARAGWDIQKNNGDGSSFTPRYKNVWYQATIGYRF